MKLDTDKIPLILNISIGMALSFLDLEGIMFSQSSIWIQSSTMHHSINLLSDLGFVASRQMVLIPYIRYQNRYS